MASKKAMSGVSIGIRNDFCRISSRDRCSIRSIQKEMLVSLLRLHWLVSHSLVIT